MVIYIEGTNQDEDDKQKREGKEVMHSFYKKGNIYCRAVPNWVLYTRRTHGEGTVIATIVKREEEESVVLPFVSFPLDNIYFITPYTPRGDLG